MSSQWIPTFFACNTASTVYAYINTWAVTPNATEANTQEPFSEAGAVNGLYVGLSAAPGAGKSYAFTLYKNGVSTSVTATVSDTSTTASFSGTLSTSAGDRFSIQEVPSGTPAAANASVSILFAPTTTDHFVYPGPFFVAGAAPRWTPLYNGSGQDSGSANVYATSPFAGTVIAFAMHLKVAPGAGTSLDFIIDNGAEVAASLTSVANANTDAITTGLSIAFAAGAGADCKFKAANGGPADPVFRSYCVTFVPTPAGQWFMACQSITAMSNSAVNYTVIDGVVAPNATEANVQFIAPGPIQAKGLFLAVTSSPGASKSYTLTSRINGVAGTISAVLTGAATSVTDTTHTDSISAGDLINIASTPASTPTSMGSWSMSLGFTVSTDPLYTSFLVFTREHDTAKDAPTTAYYFEAFLKTSSATYSAYARLYNVTDGAAVSGSTISSAVTSVTRVRSTAITLATGSKVYRAEFGGQASVLATYTCYGADIIADVST